MSMWCNLPFDLLANIFSFLSPDSLAIASSCCRNWHECAATTTTTQCNNKAHHQSWFLAIPIRINQRRPCCYAHNPFMNNWHELSLDFLPTPSIRPIASIDSLILLRVTNSTALKLILCNPFTREFRYLPMLNISRTNPAVGVVTNILDSESHFPYFRVYVAGGMSEASQNYGATYEPTSEIYDSRADTWRVVGPMPVEFSVRLTVWTPNESVHIRERDTLYWITSARAYSVMGFEIGTNKWIQLSVPNADKLEFATLVRVNGELGLVGGGTCCGGGCIWVMSGNNNNNMWCLVDKVPGELVLRLLCGKKRNWESVKCLGNEDAVCLYRELGSGMVVWRRVFGEKGVWEWVWVDGCGFVKGKEVHSLTIRGALVHPSLASSSLVSFK